jgi:hypothetical protein
MVERSHSPRRARHLQAEDFTMRRFTAFNTTAIAGMLLVAGASVLGSADASAAGGRNPGSARGLQMRADVPRTNTTTTFGYPGVRTTTTGVRRLPQQVNPQQPYFQPSYGNQQMPQDAYATPAHASTPRDGAQYNIVIAPAPTQSFAGTGQSSLPIEPAAAMQR